MPHFDIVKKSEVEETFRVSKIKADFDVKTEHASEHFVGDIQYPSEWQIGVIVGSSGTGKSTIAKTLYPHEYIKGFEYTRKSVIDDMPGKNVSDIEQMFYAVGFGSVPSWLKPYSVLSTGEKMRCDIARAMLENDFVVFDEFTSVVDRQVAKTCCIAIKKYLQKHPTKKFIAVTCHRDILEYLSPDWGFDTDTMQSFFGNAHGLKCNTQSENVSGASGRSFGNIII